MIVFFSLVGHFLIKYSSRMQKFFAMLLFLLLFFLLSVTPSFAATRTWDGQGHDNNWSTQLNWSENTVPTSADAVVFNGTSTKDSTVDATFSGTLTSISINSGYTGTVTLERNLITTSTFAQAAGTFNSGSFNTQYGSTFTVSGGTYTASSNIATFSGNFTHSAGTFNHNSGTVSLNGSLQSISGSTSFYNLSKIGSNNDLLTFPAGLISTVSGTLSLQGTGSTNILALRSTTDNVQWYLDFQGTVDMQYLTVKDSNNINATSVDVTGRSVYNLGNNVGWAFSSNNQSGAVTGVVNSLADPNNWNIRIDGPSTFSLLGYINSIRAGDVDGDGYPDLIIGAYFSNFNGNASGSVFIVTHDILEELAGKGNILDLADPNNYWIRFDGEGADKYLGINLGIADFNSNNRSDLLLVSAGTDYNSRTDSGSIYLILDTLLSGYTGRGNNVNLATSSNYNLRLDGRSANSSIGRVTVMGEDLDNNQETDLLFTMFNFTGNQDSFLVLYDSLLSPYYSSTGNTLQMGSSSDFNLAYNAGCSNMGHLKVADINGDGLKDIIATGPATTCGGGITGQMGVAYIINHALYSAYTGTGNIVDLTNGANYNIRLLGGARFDSLGGNLAVNDLDLDGKDDVVVVASGADNNGRNSSGSVYLVYGSSLSNYTGTGTTLSMGDSQNFNIRFDGAVQFSGIGSFPLVRDYDSNGKPDLLFVANTGSAGSFPGVVYFINNNLISQFSGKGNILDLANSGNYSVRWDGATSSSSFGVSLQLADLNGTGKLDLISSSLEPSASGHDSPGSVYIIYNFPHTINVNSFSETGTPTPNFSGSITAPNSTTAMVSAQFQVGSNNPQGSWTNCSVSGNNYSCQLAAPLNQGTNTIYIRAGDTNGSYTPQADYANFTFNFVSESTPSPPNPNQLPGYAEIVTVGPHHTGPIGNGGMISLSGNPANPTIGGILTNSTSVHDLFISPKELGQTDLEKKEIPVPWQQGFNIYSELYDFSALSAFNGYPILLANNPYTIVMSYDPTKLNGLTPNVLKIIYWDQASLKWKALPGPYVINAQNKTIATITKNFSLFAIALASDQIESATPVATSGSQPTVSDSSPSTFVDQPELNIAKPSNVSTNSFSKKSCFIFICW